MKPERAIEEEALVVAEGLALLADQMNERRNVRAFRMGAALGLLQLLRIAEEDDVARGPRGGERVGERHLPGLVDEEMVEAARGGVIRPEPHGSSDHRSGRDRRERIAGLVDVFNPRGRLLVVLVREAN